MTRGALGLGQYYPVDSFLHRLDPRIKLATIFIFLVALFFIDSISVMALAALAVPIMLALSKLPPLWLVRGIRPLVFIIIFTFAVHLIMTPGTELFRAGPIAGTYDGLIRGAFFTLRLILVISISSFATLTTTPVRLTDAVESLLAPGKRVGLPVHEFAMMTTIALRFIPTLLSEAQDIIMAQKARGADFSSGNIIKRARSFIPVLVPLFVSAFRRADDLAVAMEARGYTGGEGRTRLHALKANKADFIWFFATVAAIAAILLVDKGAVV